MPHHGYQRYFDDEVLAASPLQLIELLYGATLDSINAARGHVREQNIPARTRAINKALGLVAELMHCLNHDAGGTVSRNLADLYGYVMRRLIQANISQTEQPLIEAENVMSILARAWKRCGVQAVESADSNTELPGQVIHPVTDAALAAL